jgi:transposase
MEEGDRGECERIARNRKAAVNIAKRAQMLVLAARGISNRQIALELGANEHVVGRVRKGHNQRGLAVLEDRARPGRPRSSRDQQSVQKVVETVCQAPAKGLSRWSARTLAGHLDTPSATVNPSTASCGRTNYSLIGCGPLPLAPIPNLERSCWRSWRFT